MSTPRFHLGLDIGSTTVKAVLVDGQGDRIVWSDYQRHEGKQLEKTLELLESMHRLEPLVERHGARAFATGSGAGRTEELIGAKFVQEVNAVAIAAERAYPDVGSVIELGGQDAKIIVFKDDPSMGGKKKIPTMNDKCAGGTGAVLDKIATKLGISPEILASQRYEGIKIHPIAGKCGVFAETDINSLQLVGVPIDQLMASLFDAIVGQNLSVLTRGHTLGPRVLLLGGPNTFIRGMAEAWKANIPPIWEEREVDLPPGIDPCDLITVPDSAQFFAAMGAVEFGRSGEESAALYVGLDRLRRHVELSESDGRPQGLPGLAGDARELADFRERYRKAPFRPASFTDGEVVRAYLGLDGGSTSTKGVLLDGDADVLSKAYRLSGGNPIEDTKRIIAQLRDSVRAQGASLEIVGFGVTGYAKDVLKDLFGADVAIVETVAHTSSALHFYEDVDVICDVGGQDIKIMVLKDGQVKDFKLNTQCSAGNGYFLQSTAQSLGIPVERYADIAFSARSMPSFGYGCAVFMQSDIVDFQRQGWTPEEIMAGLAAVLPKNIWLYVAQIPNLARLGRRFVLQGGTQHNLAAVKAQVDFIRSKYRSDDGEPTIVVHRHCGESGAIGAALEAMRVTGNGKRSRFIGFADTETMTYETTTNEETRCGFCKNTCLRTFIDVRFDQGNGRGTGQPPREATNGSRVPLAPGARRLIVGNSCEKGLVEDVESMRAIKAGLDATAKDTPNLVEFAARQAFVSYRPPLVADSEPRSAFTRAQRARAHAWARRTSLRIGIPRVLALYQVAPLFRTYFESLGIQSKNIVFSSPTSSKLYREGANRGAIDPCFPSKLAIPHVHNLLFDKHERNPLDVIFFPMIDDVPSEMTCAIGHRICPTITATPEPTRAAFTKESDLFGKRNIRFMNTFVNIGQRGLFERQMYEGFSDLLGLSPAENERAIAAGLEALRTFQEQQRGEARAELARLASEDRIGLVMLGRPYHADDGINHEIIREFQKRGYPIFTPSSLPTDPVTLERIFGREIEQGLIRDGLDIRDVWKNSYSENSNWKIWAAKFTARHPNLIALEISSFRCGHDAPILNLIEAIIESSGTPFFSFRDLDENKAWGSIKLRIETIHYFLRRYREGLSREKPLPMVEAAHA